MGKYKCKDCINLEERLFYWEKAHIKLQIQHITLQKRFYSIIKVLEKHKDFKNIRKNF